MQEQRASPRARVNRGSAPAVPPPLSAPHANRRPPPIGHQSHGAPDISRLPTGVWNESRAWERAGQLHARSHEISAAGVQGRQREHDCLARKSAYAWPSPTASPRQHQACRALRCGPQPGRPHTTRLPPQATGAPVPTGRRGDAQLEACCAAGPPAICRPAAARRRRPAAARLQEPWRPPARPPRRSRRRATRRLRRATTTLRWPPTWLRWRRPAPARSASTSCTATPLPRPPSWARARRPQRWSTPGPASSCRETGPRATCASPPPPRWRTGWARPRPRCGAAWLPASPPTPRCCATPWTSCSRRAAAATAAGF